MIYVTEMDVDDASFRQVVEDLTTQYYTQQLERKKDLGGRYNEKFFAHIQDEGEEFDDVPDEE